MFRIFQDRLSTDFSRIFHYYDRAFFSFFNPGLGNAMCEFGKRTNGELNIKCFKITKMRDYAAINLRRNSLRKAVPSNVFCGFHFSNFKFQSEKHRQEFPYN